MSPRLRSSYFLPLQPLTEALVTGRQLSTLRDHMWEDAPWVGSRSAISTQADRSVTSCQCRRPSTGTLPPYISCPRPSSWDLSPLAWRLPVLPCPVSCSTTQVSRNRLRLATSPSPSLLPMGPTVPLLSTPCSCSTGECGLRATSQASTFLVCQ